MVIRRRKKVRGHTQVFNDLYDLYQPIVGHSAISLYNNLQRYVNNIENHEREGLAYPTLATLAKKMKMAKRTLIDKRDLLVGVELLDVFREEKQVGNIKCLRYYYDLLEPLEFQEFFLRFGKDFKEKAGEDYYDLVFKDLLISRVSNETSTGVSYETVKRKILYKKIKSSSILGQEQENCENEIESLEDIFIETMGIEFYHSNVRQQIESLLNMWGYEYVLKQMEYTRHTIERYAKYYHPSDKSIHSYWGFVYCACRDNYAKARLTYSTQIIKTRR